MENNEPLISPLSRKYYNYAAEQDERKHHRAEDIRICLEKICNEILIDIQMPSNFSFKDMKELYQITTLISEGIFASSIECFSDAETQLREEIKLTLRDIDFKYFPDIRELLLQFVEISLKYDQKKAWLDAKKAGAKDKTLADAVSELLETDADEWYEQIKTGEKERPHSMIHPYIALYEMLNEERCVILKYKEQIEKLN